MEQDAQDIENRRPTVEPSPEPESAITPHRLVFDGVAVWAILVYMSVAEETEEKKTSEEDEADWEWVRSVSFDEVGWKMDGRIADWLIERVREKAPWLEGSGELEAMKAERGRFLCTLRDGMGRVTAWTADTSQPLIMGGVEEGGSEMKRQEEKKETDRLRGKSE